MPRSQLQSLARDKGLPIELLPGKMVHTRKANSGAYRSRAVVCSNYQEANAEDKYADGADGCQIRAMIRTAALDDWCLAGTDIRVAFFPKQCGHTEAFLRSQVGPGVQSRCSPGGPAFFPVNFHTKWILCNVRVRFFL